MKEVNDRSKLTKKEREREREKIMKWQQIYLLVSKFDE